MPISTSNRRRLCENAYQNTRAMLWEQREEIGRKLARHGLKLRLPVLADAGMTLVNQAGPREDHPAASLHEALDRLERQLKLKAG